MFNPIEASDNIKQSYADYISTTFHIADPHYQKSLRAALGKSGGIAKGPYLDVSGSFESGRSLQELIAGGQASSEFLHLETAPEKEKEIKLHRPLYAHQEQSFSAAAKGNNLVITTGTGSGKTECFLLPVLQALLTEKQAGTLNDAVRAIIIYPMNALANDQMKRLRKMLSACPEITFGLYNSNTPYEQRKAVPNYRALNKEQPLINEVISREVMQQKPPHILITNYSMLEYMMLRPKDDTVFSGAKLRYIIMDEAHIYRGATGMETSLLMRRLRARISTPDTVQYILTSATLGDESANRAIVAFAQTLCDAPFRAENIIRSRKIRQPMVEYRDFPTRLFRDLSSETQPVGAVLKSYDADFAPDGDDSEKLYALMLRSRLFANLREVSTSPKTIGRLAGELGISRQELVDLISVSAKAVKEGTSLIKSRYHFFLRALEGAFVTLAGSRELMLTRRECDQHGNAVFECAVCEDCGRMAVVGTVEENKLRQPRDSFDNSAEYFLVKQTDEGNFFTVEDEEEAGTDAGDYVLCPVCGSIEMESVAKKTAPCSHGGYIKLRKSQKRKTGQAACPACEPGNFRCFYLGYDAATAVVGTALYEQLPESATVFSPVEPVAQEGFFGRSMPKAKQQIRQARQFLAFSDSRADAAFFASYMEKSYQEFLRRRGLWQVCDKLLSEGRGTATVRDMVVELTRLFEKSGSFVELGREAEAQTDTCRSHAYKAVMNELVSGRRSSGLVQLGKLAYVYAPKDRDKSERWANAVEVITGLLPRSAHSERDARALLNLLITDLVYAGVIDGGTEFDLTAEEREYLFYAPVQKKAVKMQTDKAKSYLVSWLPKKRTGKTQSYYYSTRLLRVARALSMTDEQAWDLLENLWRQVLDLEDATEYTFPVQDFDIRLCDQQKGIALYRCNRCGRVTADNCQDRCTNVKCGGTLVQFHAAEENAGNHYANLYSIPNMSPLYIKEHTAQLSRDHAADYQNKFVEKKINALSSSTTFEMGVDVGSLETVFLRNVPPTPANYAQRAGRAGRSVQSAAYALTYAKLGSHDFTYFEHPADMISGKIKAPAFKLENEKVVRRHMNAIALSAFFKRHEAVFSGNDQTVFLNGDGYETFKEYLASRPDDLKNLLMLSIPSPGSFGVSNWSWPAHLVGETGILELAVSDFRETIQEIERERSRCRKAGDDNGAAAYARKLRDFRGDTAQGEPRKPLIDFLVRNNILPKYGFPIDTVELLPDAANFSGSKKQPTMQRDLQMAVAEYAPGAEVVADGKLYTSRYIRKLQSKNTHNWEYGWHAICPNSSCNTVNFYKDNAPRKALACISCGETIPKLCWHQTLEPRRGFISEKPVEVKMRKPDRVYKTDDYYIGDPLRKTIDKVRFSFGGNPLTVESTTNDSLVVLTRSHFRVCPVCGYAVGEDEGKPFGAHNNAYGHKCMNEDRGKEYYLSHDFKTDVARITFETPQAGDLRRMISVLYALLEAVSKELDIERNDIKGCLYKAKLDSGVMVNSVVLYDAVAGGAGHIRRIVTPDGAVLSRVIAHAICMMESCDCEPSCYKCLRNYYNQKIHNALDRNAAAEFLQDYTGELEILPEFVVLDPPELERHVQITESTPLKETYSDWAEAAVLFEDYTGFAEAMQAQRIPLADSFEVQLQAGDHTIEAVAMWQESRILVCNDILSSARAVLADMGWTCLDISALTEEALSQAFGGVLLG